MMYILKQNKFYQAKEKEELSCFVSAILEKLRSTEELYEAQDSS